MKLNSNDLLQKRWLTPLTWLLSFILAAFFSLAVAMRLGFLTGLHRKLTFPLAGWVALILLGTTILTFLLRWIFTRFLKTFDPANLRKFGLISLFLYLLFGAFLALAPSGRHLLARLWVGGRRGLVIDSAYLALLLLIIPCLLFILQDLFNEQIDSLLSKLHASLNYQRGFIAVWLAISLLSLVNLRDLKDPAATLWGRNDLINLYSTIRFDLGDHLYNLSYKTNNDWFVFLGEDSIIDYQRTNLFSDSQLADIQNKLNGLNDRLKARGITLLVVIPPDKNTIYPEYVPPQIPVLNPRSRLDQLVEYEKKNGGVQILDLRPALLKAKQDRLVYFPCDTHWNPYGAFVGYRAIMQKLAETFPGLRVHSLDDYRYTPTDESCDMPYIAHLDLAGNKFSLQPLFPYQVQQRNWNAVAGRGSFIAPGSDEDDITVINADQSLPRLLMFRDSFGGYLMPFLSADFSRSVYLLAYPSDESVYDFEKPDVVIIEFTERYLDFLSLIPDN